jgi:hypothetical protein
MGSPLEVEHIIPVSGGGETVIENLWLTCHRCNRFKSNRTHAADPETGENTPLYNPRRQRWHEHFRWSQDATHVQGIDAISRATVEALQMNNTYVVESRRFWVLIGWHPPLE